MAALIPAWVDGHLVAHDKLEVHRLGLRHMAVSVFVLVGEALLLQRRALGKYHTPGLWANTCCTHPHWGESAADCARRRLGEELGLHGFDPAPAHRVEYRAEVGGGMTEHEVVDIFVLRLPEMPVLAPDPAEVMETRWLTIAGLQAEIAADPSRFTPWLRIYLADHLSGIFGAP